MELILYLPKLVNPLSNSNHLVLIGAFKSSGGIDNQSGMWMSTRTPSSYCICFQFSMSDEIGWVRKYMVGLGEWVRDTEEFVMGKLEENKAKA